MAVPNRLQLVNELANKYPTEFRQAHTDSSNKDIFIRIVAYELFQEDERWGLNGKRGDPNNISLDALNWKGEGVGYDPTNNERPVTVIDIIAGAGGPNPAPAWQVFNDPNKDRGPGAWVKPQPVPGYHTIPGTPAPVPEPPKPTPPPVSENDVAKLIAQVDTLIGVVGQLIEATKDQTALFRNGFSVKAKGGWPIGDMSGTVQPKSQG